MSRVLTFKLYSSDIDNSQVLPATLSSIIKDFVTTKIVARQGKNM